MKSLRRFLFNGRNLLPLAMVGFFFFIALAAPKLSPPSDPSDPQPFKLVESFSPYPLPPGEQARWGTIVHYAVPDAVFHYDVFHSLVWGTREALRFGLVTALTTACLGLLVGVISGYVGGIANILILRITDAFLAFPVISAVWLFRQLMSTADINILQMGQDGDMLVTSLASSPLQAFILQLDLDPVMMALIFFSWMPYARLLNAGVLRLKQTDFVMAARAVGVSPFRLMLRHLLPNGVAPAIVLAARDVGGMVILQAAFAFIRNVSLSSPDQVSGWAWILLLGRSWIISAGGNLLLNWRLYVPATLALILFGTAWNLLGDRLNDLLNPRIV